MPCLFRSHDKQRQLSWAWAAACRTDQRWQAPSIIGCCNWGGVSTQEGLRLQPECCYKQQIGFGEREKIFKIGRLTFTWRIYMIQRWLELNSCFFLGGGKMQALGCRERIGPLSLGWLALYNSHSYTRPHSSSTPREDRKMVQSEERNVHIQSTHPDDATCPGTDSLGKRGGVLIIY